MPRSALRLAAASQVKFATDTETQTHYAIKVFSREQMASRDLQTQIKKEIAIMKHVRHPNVVNLREVLASKTHVYIVLELVTGGELFDRIVTSGVRAAPRDTALWSAGCTQHNAPARVCAHSPPSCATLTHAHAPLRTDAGKLEERLARVYFQQLIDGVAYCHERGVCHRDLKPENLLLDAAGRLKISDFGLSSLPEHHGQARGAAAGATCARVCALTLYPRVCVRACVSTCWQSMESLQTTCGTPNYVAPEVLRGQGCVATRSRPSSWLCPQKHALTNLRACRAATATTAAARTCGPPAASCTCSPRAACPSTSRSWRRSSSSSQTQNSRRVCWRACSRSPRVRSHACADAQRMPPVDAHLPARATSNERRFRRTFRSRCATSSSASSRPTPKSAPPSRRHAPRHVRARNRARASVPWPACADGRGPMWCRAFTAQIRAHEWFTPGYVPVVVADAGDAPERAGADEDAEFMEVDVVRADAHAGSATTRPAAMTAFDLIGSASGLDLSAMFEKGCAVAKRPTRFASMCVHVLLCACVPGS
jgi:serine/threonine protein kinase